jgi:hypothetical protein
MIVLQGTLKHCVISILFSIFIVGTASAGETGSSGDMSNWNSYSDAESGFSFMYPKDWEVIYEGFYKTSYGATIQKIGGNKDSNNWIRINSPQFQISDGKCIEVDNQRICTYSKDADVLDIFERLAASFKVMADRVDEKDQVWSFK